MTFCFKETLGIGYTSGYSIDILSADWKISGHTLYTLHYTTGPDSLIACVWCSLWHGSEKVTQMLQLILDLLQGITPLPGSAWTRFIFFIICIKNKSMKKKNRWCEARLLLARNKKSVVCGKGSSLWRALHIFCDHIRWAAKFLMHIEDEELMAVSSFPLPVWFYEELLWAYCAGNDTQSPKWNKVAINWVLTWSMNFGGAH